EGAWRDALELARRLEATETFGAGLRLTPDGRDLAERIGAEAAGSDTANLRLEGVPLAEGFRELAETPRPPDKIALLAREASPTPAFTRWWTPIARRGRPGLLAAYAWRVVWLAYRAGPGYLAWRRARRPAV